VCEAIESVLVESINLEVIVVDDCSSDGSWEALQQRYAGSSRVRLIRHEKSQGPATARNTGLRAARGHYLTFLDDDDLSIAGRIESQIALAKSESADFVTSSVCLFETADGERQHGRPFDRITLRNVWPRNPFINVTCLAESRLIKSLEFDPLIKNGEDLDLWIRCLLTCRKTVNYSNPVIRYRRMGHASASRNRIRRFRSRLIFLRKYASLMGPGYAALHLAITVAKLAVPEPHLFYNKLRFLSAKSRSHHTAFS
jgi:glycosyltransferase involved in cell wall biosynthesis